MAALLDKKRLKATREAKAQRMQSIREAAAYFFARLPYDEVTLDAIGSRAGVRQGQTIMYFGSKEELFAVVLRQKLEEWAESLSERLKSMPRGDESEMASVLATSFTENSGLCRFLAEAAMVLELGIQMEAADSALRVMHHRLDQLGEVIESQLPRLARGAGKKALRRLMTTVTGAYPYAEPRGAVAMALCDGRIEDLRINLNDEIEDVARILLHAAMK
ncbi:MAG: TetR/AcrR family transcriptional regulator [bacterium]|nr:TetR/AcrR family transcriptional regulator [bacterium]